MALIISKSKLKSKMLELFRQVEASGKKFPKQTLRAVNLLIAVSLVACGGMSDNITETPKSTQVEALVVVQTATPTTASQPPEFTPAQPTPLPGGPDFPATDVVIVDEGLQNPDFTQPVSSGWLPLSETPDSLLAPNVSMVISEYEKKAKEAGYNIVTSLKNLKSDNDVFVTAVHNGETSSYQWTVFGVTRKGFLMPVDENQVILGNPADLRAGAFKTFILNEDDGFGKNPTVVRVWEEFGGVWTPVVRHNDGTMLAYFDVNAGWVFNYDTQVTSLTRPTPTEAPFTGYIRNMRPVETWKDLIYNWNDDKMLVTVAKERDSMSVFEMTYLVAYELTPDGVIGYFRKNNRDILKTYIHYIYIPSKELIISLVKGNITNNLINTTKTELDKILSSDKYIDIFFIYFQTKKSCAEHAVVYRNNCSVIEDNRYSLDKPEELYKFIDKMTQTVGDDLSWDELNKLALEAPGAIVELDNYND